MVAGSLLGGDLEDFALAGFHLQVTNVLGLHGILQELLQAGPDTR